MNGWTIGDTFTPEQRLKMAEMTCQHEIELNNLQKCCCKERIRGNERVLAQMEKNNAQSMSCCNSLASVTACCCKGGSISSSCGCCGGGY